MIFHNADLNSRRLGHGPLIIDTVYNNDVSDSLGRFIPLSEGRFVIRNSALVISMIKSIGRSPVNELTFQSYASLLVKYFRNGRTTLDSVRVKLSIDYNRNAGTTYKAKDFFTLENVRWAIVRLDTFYCSIPADEFLENQLLSLSSQLLGEEDIIPNRIEATTRMSPMRIDFIESKNDMYIYF